MLTVLQGLDERKIVVNGLLIKGDLDQFIKVSTSTAVSVSVYRRNKILRAMLRLIDRRREKV